jgi:DNA-binding MarR family transcriptional regulator
MEHRLQKEIRQGKPFASAEEEAFLNLMRTAALLEHDMAETFKDYGITPTQYNVLRILRGAGEKGLCRNDVRDRLVALVPDATRLLDRMMEMGLISRVRDADDRRYVTARITSQGLALLERLDGPVAEAHRRQFGRLTKTEVQELTTLLEKTRSDGR